MSRQIKSITFEGELEVWGVYNYNGLWSILEKHEKNGSTFYKKHRSSDRTPPQRDNHMYAKTFIDKETDKEIDYTSSRCLRHEIFKDIQPRQPSDKTFAQQFIQMAASEVGLLRGYLSPDEGLKRCSPLHIADAKTVDNAGIVFDQGSSSKPKEGDKKDKQGKEKKDTSLFSKDSIPYRRQKLLGGINLKELQFLSLYGIDNDFSMIAEKDKEEFLKLLKEYFKKRNVDHSLEIKQYNDINAIYKVKRDGILLNQAQVRHLVKVIFQRIKMINGLKSGARIAYKKDSLKVSFFDGNNSLDIKDSDLKENLKNMNFYHFFEINRKD